MESNRSGEKKEREEKDEKSVINHDDTSKTIDWLRDKSLVFVSKQIKQSDQMFESSKFKSNTTSLLIVIDKSSIVKRRS